MREIWAFLGALVREWKAIITSSLAAAVLFVVGQVAAVPIPRLVLGLFVIIGVLVAAFKAWKIERSGRHAAELREKQHREREEGEEALVMECSDPEFWLLSQVARFGLQQRTEIFERPGKPPAWGMTYRVGNRPIDPFNCTWFYDLANETIHRGLLFIEGSAVRLAPDAKRAIEVGVRKGRTAKRPLGELSDAFTGETIEDFSPAVSPR